MSPRPRLTEDVIAEHARLLVEAAFRVVAATGDSSPSVRLILDEAGLSRQVFYRCFESSDDLMAAVLAEGSRILADYLRGRMAKARTPEDKVRAWVVGVMRQAETATERTRPFITSPHVPRNGEALGGVGASFAGLLADAISEGVDAGLWTRDDPMADALIIQDFVFASMQRHLFQMRPPTSETIRRLADFAVNGLFRARAAVRST